MQGQRPDRWWLGYVQAAAITALAAALKWVLDRGFGELPAYITFYPAVVICSMLGGIGPGIMATLLGLLLADLLFIEPIGRLTVAHGADAVGMLLFALFGMAISFIGGRLRTAASSQTRRSESLAEALAKEHANLQAVFDVVNVGMLVIDEDGAVRQVNNTVSRWLGRDVAISDSDQPGDLVGCIHALAEPAGCGHTPHCVSCPIRNTFASVLRDGQPVHDVEAQAALSIDGKEVRLWLDVSADPLLLNGKRHVILALNNVTARKRAEEALLQTTEELARSNSDLEQFASVVSHDLQEPLRAVTGFVQLLRQKYEARLGPDADQYITFAVEGAKRMETLIRDLLAYSRDRRPRPGTLADRRRRGPSAGLGQSPDEHPGVGRRDHARRTAHRPRRRHPASPTLSEPYRQRPEVPRRGSPEDPHRRLPRGRPLALLRPRQRHRHRLEGPGSHLPYLPASAHAASSIRARASVWPSASGSWTATAAGSGWNRTRDKAPRSILPFQRKVAGTRRVPSARSAHSIATTDTADGTRNVPATFPTSLRTSRRNWGRFLAFRTAARKPA